MANDISDEQIFRLKLAIYRISGGDFDATDEEVRQIALAASEARAAPSLEMECEDCGGSGEVGEEVYQGEFQPPERYRCDSCDGSGRWKIEASATGAEPTEFEKTFPGHIWLDAGEAVEFAEPCDSFRDLHEVTWSEDNATSFGVKYVRADLATPTSAPVQAEGLAGWSDAYAAFKGAFDTPLARQRDNSEFAQDARRRLRDFDESYRAAAPVHEGLTASLQERVKALEAMSDEEAVSLGRTAATNNTYSEGRFLTALFTRDALIGLVRAVEAAHGIAALEAGKEEA